MRPFSSLRKLHWKKCGRTRREWWISQRSRHTADMQSAFEAFNYLAGNGKITENWRAADKVLHLQLSEMPLNIGSQALSIYVFGKTKWPFLERKVELSRMHFPCRHSQCKTEEMWRCAEAPLYTPRVGSMHRGSVLSSRVGSMHRGPGSAACTEAAYGCKGQFQIKSSKKAPGAPWNKENIMISFCIW